MSVEIKPIKWLPNNSEAIRSFIRSLKERCLEDLVQRKRKETLLKLHPPVNSHDEAHTGDLQLTVSKEEMEILQFHEPVQELYVQILTDPAVNMFFHQMFWQQKEEGREVRNWQMFIFLLNAIMEYTPVYSNSHLVGFPINA